MVRRTKIVATVGPATAAAGPLEALLRAGVDVVRLNFAHGTREEHEGVFRAVREIATRLDRPVAILQDLAGPKIRIGHLVGGMPITLEEGKTVTITTRSVIGNAKLLSTSYSRLPQDVREGNLILLADGNITLRVKALGADAVDAVVMHGGILAEHQGINLPGVAISAPALGEKDLQDLAFGVSLGVDFVGLSFVRDPAEVRRAKELIASYGASIPVIAKLEKREAIDRLDEILAVSDGVMVARGDLGVEIPLEEVPVLQKTIIHKANERGVAVITATQMLESMIKSPRPTRAEVSDVANAILDGTDAVMLSGETAVGQYPVQAVEMMDRIAQATRHAPYDVAGRPRTSGNAEAIARAAAMLAEEVRAKAIIVFTRSGHTARLMCRERPSAPILAFSNEESTYRHLALRWGTIPLRSEFQAHTDAMLAHAEQVLQARLLVSPGDQVVFVGSVPLLAEARTNFVKLQRIGG